MEKNSKDKQQSNTKKYCFSPYSNPKYNRYFGKDTPATEESSSNMVLLTPAIFGGLGAFMVGFLLSRYRRRDNFKNRGEVEGSVQYVETPSREPYKLEFFFNILSLIALFGATAYIFEEIRKDGGIRRFTAVVPTVVIIIFLFASEDFLIYSVCPGCYEGIVGKSSVGDFMNFIALSIGSISVGESYGITPMTTGTKLLLAQESLFNLFVLALLISFVVGDSD